MGLLFGAPGADGVVVSPDAAPIVAAQTLLARGITDETVVARIAVAWRLDDAKARAAVAAAHVLLGAHDCHAPGAALS